MAMMTPRTNQDEEKLLAELRAAAQEVVDAADSYSPSIVDYAARSLRLLESREARQLARAVKLQDVARCF